VGVGVKVGDGVGVAVGLSVAVRVRVAVGKTLIVTGVRQLIVSITMANMGSTRLCIKALYRMNIDVSIPAGFSRMVKLALTNQSRHVKLTLPEPVTLSKEGVFFGE
jgi:hypothetical protein